MWTQKEIAYLKDLKSKEQLCVEKYRKYAEQALDPALKGLFERIGQVEQRHVQVVEGMLNGTLPQQNAAGAQQNPQAPCRRPIRRLRTPPSSRTPICVRMRWAWRSWYRANTKRRSSSSAPRRPRAALNQLQKDEQQHGEALYQYMQRNAMAS